MFSIMAIHLLRVFPTCKTLILNLFIQIFSVVNVLYYNIGKIDINLFDISAVFKWLHPIFFHLHSSPEKECTCNVKIDTIIFVFIYCLSGLYPVVILSTTFGTISNLGESRSKWSKRLK